MQPPDLFPFLHFIPTAVWGVLALAAVAVLLYRNVLRGLGFTGSIFFFALLCVVGIAYFGIHSVIASWQYSIKHPQPQKPVVSNTLSPGIPQVPDMGANLSGTSPIAHFNSWVLSAMVLIAIIWGIGYLIYRGMSPSSRARFLNRLRGGSTSATRRRRKKTDAEYEYTEVELGIDKQTGKPIVVGDKDRFIGTLVVGSQGTGKSSRILAKGAYQDIQNIALGVPMDVLVMDPDGGLVQDVVQFSREHGIEPFVIDLKGELQTNFAIDPFSGGEIADIVDNIRAALREQMGDGDVFFQNAADDHVRTVIQVLVPLWPDTDFIQFAELVTDPIHFRSICNMVVDYAMPKSGRDKKKKDELEALQAVWEYERAHIEQMYDELPPHLRSMVLSAARSFIQDTRNEQKLEHLEKITKGLKIVVNELATNQQMRQSLGKNGLPKIDFAEFLACGHDEPGRVIAVITDNRPIGDLFGKLFLLIFKMHLLRRKGNENTRRPVYAWIDEFHRYATPQLGDVFAQARKYRFGPTYAIQLRSQLMLASNRKFIEVVEGGCRNKIYFPSPAPADAQFLEKSLGSVMTIKETHSENRLGMFISDGRGLDRKISTREQDEARFSMEDLLYGLSDDEAVFVMTVNNRAQAPAVGYTSYATEWVRKHGIKRKAPKAKPKKTPKKPLTSWLPRVCKGEKAPADVQPRLTIVNNDVEVAAALSVSTPPQVSHTRSTVEETKGVEDRQPIAVIEKPIKSYLKPTADPADVIVIGERQQPSEDVPAPAETSPDPTDGTDAGEDGGSIVAPVQAATNVEPQVEHKRPDAEPERINLRPSVGVPALTADLQKATTESSSPIATRIDLRRKTVPVPEGPNDSAGHAAGKLCPQCKADSLKLTADARKWHCPTCGFERKNRAQNQG